MQKYKHFVFLLGPGYPKPSAVANCGLNVARELSKHSKVSLVFIGPKDAELNLLASEFSKSDVFFVDTLYLKIHRYLSKKSSVPYLAMFFLIRFLGVLSKFLSITTISKRLVANIELTLSEINSKYPIDNIVACCFPFENVVAAAKFSRSNSDVRYTPYLFDDFVNSNTLHVSAVNKFVKSYFNKKLFSNSLSDASFILAMHGFRAVKGFEFSNVLFTEHPLLIEPKPVNHSLSINSHTNKRIIYAGNFLLGHVEPDYIISLIQGANLQNLNFEFFGSGNAYGKLIDLAKRIDFVSYRGFIQRNELDLVLSDAAAAISVGEALGKQLSSKIFDYMSHCLPIIHIAYHYDCQTAHVLKKYPISCVIYVEDEFSVNLEKFKEFMLAINLKGISFVDVAEIYPDALPSYTSDLILKNCNL